MKNSSSADSSSSPKPQKNTSANDKLKRLQNVIKKINSGRNEPVIQFGAETLEKFGYYETPFATLNDLCRGIPIGRFTTIAGASQVGKSALTLQIIAHLQNIDPEFVAVWVDYENSWDPDWAATLGVDLERIIVVTYSADAQNMEAVMDQVITLIETREIGIVVVDSIGGMTPKGDIMDKDKTRSLEKSNMLNLQTKLGEIYRLLNIKIAPSGDFKGTAVIFLGHIYQVPNQQGFHISEVRGGNAVKHWAHIRLSMKRGPKDDWPKEIEVTNLDGKKRKVRPGFSGRILLEKTKTNANEGQEIALGFYHGRGYDFIQSTISAALGLEIIERSGAWYSCDLFPEEKLQGRDAIDRFFESNEEAYQELTKLVDQKATQPNEEVEVKDEC
jgi:recombination protein RecA